MDPDPRGPKWPQQREEVIFEVAGCSLWMAKGFPWALNSFFTGIPCDEIPV